uniref:Uncharacterized protein n=1 Tax=viral metagenome TaxID=1070528 RepID=A0A6M3L355_9ZZZZ
MDTWGNIDEPLADVPVKALWQIYVVDESETPVKSGTILAYSALEAMEKLELHKVVKKDSKVTVYAKEIGYPFSDTLVSNFIKEKVR